MIASARKKSPEELYRDLLRRNPEAMIVMGFEDAYVGATATVPAVAVYDYDECVIVLAAERQCSDDEAERFLLNEVMGDCLDADAPLFVRCP
jgi:hypothetical protein